MADQSAVAFRHMGSRSFTLGPNDSLAGIIPDEIDAGALCYVIATATYYQWNPGDPSADNPPSVIRPAGRPGAGAWKPISGITNPFIVNVPLVPEAYSAVDLTPPTFPDAWTLLYLSGVPGDITIYRQIDPDPDEPEALFSLQLPSAGRILAVVLTCQGREHVSLPESLPNIRLLSQPAAGVAPDRYPLVAPKSDPSADLAEYEALHAIIIDSVAGELGVNGLTIDPTRRYIVRVSGEGGVSAVAGGFDIYSLRIVIGL